MLESAFQNWLGCQAKVRQILRSVGQSMRLFKSASQCAFLLSCAIFLVCLSSVAAQEKPAAPDRSSAQSSRRPLPSKKQAAKVEPDQEQESSTRREPANDSDGPEAIRKRAEWFYKQRSSVGGHIPAGARLKAFQHMQRMMEAEGKLVRQPDGGYLAVTPEAGPAVGGTWSPLGPAPTTGGNGRRVACGHDRP